MNEQMNYGRILRNALLLTGLGTAILVACAFWKPEAPATAAPSNAATLAPAPTDRIELAEPNAGLEGPLHVCDACEIKSIQAAIEAALPGTVIQVAGDIYPERLVVTKSLALEGGWNAEFSHRDVVLFRTVIDGQGLGTVVSISTTSPITVDGFQITGGGAQRGGGLWIAGAQALVRNNLISGNQALDGISEGWGGGVYAVGNNTVLLLDANMIVSNTARLGGGVLIDGVAWLTMTNNIVVNNAAAQGGGIYALPPGSAHVVNNTFVQNTPSAVVAKGGALVVANSIFVSHGVAISATMMGSTLLPTHNLFHANGQNYAGALTTWIPTNDVVADPLLVSDYHLAFLSPAIDRGVAWAAPSHDVDGQPRPIGLADIGADEAGMALRIPHALGHFTPPRTCPYGVGIWPPSEVPVQIGRGQELGICWTRVNVEWDRIEPIQTTPRTYDWEATDGRLLSVWKTGINPIALVGANPSWAALYPGGPVTDTQDILEFLTVAAERYDGDGFMDAPGSPVIQVWELYNEPDNHSLTYAEKRGWAYWGGRGVEYAQFLSLARGALRSANPNALVAFGGLAHETVYVTPGGEEAFDLEFPADVFGYIRDHPGDYFDLFNFHFFRVFANVYSDWGPDIMGKTEYFRELMDQHEVSWPIIVTEAGYWSSSVYPNPWIGSHEEQARYAVQLYSRGAAADLRLTMWLLLFDLPVHEAERGLYDLNGEPKPAYNAYKTMIKSLGNLRFERTLSPEELGTSSAEGYAFVSMNGSRRIYVVWTTGSQTASTLRVAAPSVTVSDKVSDQLPMVPTIPYFTPYPVADGDDGAQDGYTEVGFGSSPIYVEVNP